MKMSSKKDRKLMSRLKIFRRALEDMEGKPIIVEGKKDMNALRRCGIKERIIVLKGRPDDICRSLRDNDEAVILTDFDKRGEELSAILSDNLRSYGTRPNIECRRRLKYSVGVRVFQELDKRVAEFENEIRTR